MFQGMVALAIGTDLVVTAVSKPKHVIAGVSRNCNTMPLAKISTKKVVRKFRYV